MLLERLLNGLSVRVDSVGLCKVSPGWRLSLPGPVNGVIVHFVLTGSGEFVVPKAATVQSLKRRSMVVVPTGLRHGLQCGADATEELLVPAGTAVPTDQGFVAGDGGRAAVVVACGAVAADYADSLDLFHGLRDALSVDLSDSEQAAHVFEEIIKQQDRRRPGYQQLTNSLMFQGLVLFLRRLCGGEDCPLPWLEALEDPRLARVLDHLLDDPGRPHTVDSLAAVAGMSRSAFACAFADGFGQSPKRFVNRVRMTEAAKLLQRSDLSVGQVSRRLGFASRSHFSRAFSRRFGVPPSRFRVAGR